MISVILIEPEWASNVGAVARVMGNFDFKELVLVNPKCKVSELDAVKRAKHAAGILKKAKVRKSMGKYDLLVGTTSKLGSSYNIPRLPIPPEQLSSKLSKINLKNKRIGLAFGREGEGLHNDEIKKCDLVVSIPSSVKYPALNLSHSAAIVLYEIFKASSKDKIGENFDLISGNEKRKLIELVDSRIDKMEFATKDKRKNMKMLWRRLIGKSFLTKREAFGLFGFFRKIR
ncbi:TrmJ/YjtD family RNA methyltransferase [Candidatus Woesearchaeota archaeon]|nr:TrmJ/YjtD family RNA methyltransferase [Candidatus Woesearchaeota archaeon]